MLTEQPLNEHLTDLDLFFPEDWYGQVPPADAPVAWGAVGVYRPEEGANAVRLDQQSSRGDTAGLLREFLPRLRAFIKARSRWFHHDFRITYVEVVGRVTMEVSVLPTGGELRVGIWEEG